MAQVVERPLREREVPGSSPGGRSKIWLYPCGRAEFFAQASKLLRLRLKFTRCSWV